MTKPKITILDSSPHLSPEALQAADDAINAPRPNCPKCGAKDGKPVPLIYGSKHGKLLSVLCMTCGEETILTETSGNETTDSK